MSRDNLLPQQMGVYLHPEALDKLDEIMRYLIDNSVSGRKIARSHGIEWALKNVKVPVSKKIKDEAECCYFYGNGKCACDDVLSEACEAVKCGFKQSNCTSFKEAE